MFLLDMDIHLPCLCKHLSLTPKFAAAVALPDLKELSPIFKCGATFLSILTIFCLAAV